jgi:hypothetical protein
MNGCGLCGGELDDHGVKVTITFAAGLRNGRHFTEVPYRLEDWAICWKCFTDTPCRALRLALADEYIEPVIGPRTEHCHVTCHGGRIMARRGLRGLFSVRAGSRGVPEAWARCPVCLGPTEVERAHEQAS